VPLNVIAAFLLLIIVWGGLGLFAVITVCALSMIFGFIAGVGGLIFFLIFFFCVYCGIHKNRRHPEQYEPYPDFVENVYNEDKPHLLPQD
jgi:hypothetical protein